MVITSCKDGANPYGMKTSYSLTPMMWRIENFDPITTTQRQAILHIGIISGPRKVPHHCYNKLEVDTLLQLHEGVDAIDGSRVGKSLVNPTGKFTMHALCLGTMQDYVGEHLYSL